MATDTATSGPGGAGRFDAIAVARELGPTLAQRAAAHDADDSFVADSYADFKARKLFSAGVPAPLGGGGATHPELCAMLQEIGRCCGSSALALSMHTHLLATTVWQWKHGMPAARTAAESLLRRVSAEELILVSSGGSDWLEGSGKAEKVDGGFRVNARKIFASGSPSGQLLVTTAVYDDPVAGATVLHLPVPLDGPGVHIHDNWRTMGMRATGSNDITIEGVFVPDHAVGVRRPKGKWHEFFDVHSAVVWPLVMSVYVGVARSSAAARAGPGGEEAGRSDRAGPRGRDGHASRRRAGRAAGDGHARQRLRLPAEPPAFEQGLCVQDDRGAQRAQHRRARHGDLRRCLVLSKCRHRADLPRHPRCAVPPVARAQAVRFQRARCVGTRAGVVPAFASSPHQIDKW